MRGSEFDEVSFFSAVERSGARALLIGRRAMVVLGLPVLTADYDFWVHSDDVEKLNVAARPFDLEPNRTPNEARRHGRYVLGNDEHVDVLVSATRTTVDGLEVEFDSLWSRRVSVEIGAAKVFIPSVDDLNSDQADRRTTQGCGGHPTPAAPQGGAGMSRTNPPSQADLRAARRFAERVLAADAFDAYVNAPVSEDEREEAVRLIRWFSKRYRTPAQRLAYVRRAYARWAQPNRG